MDRVHVLIPFDVEGWAWWHKARAIQRLIRPPVRVETIRFGQPFDPAAFDFVLPFGHYMLAGLSGVGPEKILLGSSCNHSDYLDAASKLLRSAECRAVFANSRFGYEVLKEHGRAYLCQNGVDADLFQPAEQHPEALTCCWVGNPYSDGKKGFDLIQAACERTGVVLNYHSWDASKGNETGIVPQTEIRDKIYHKAHAYICASDNEATPNPALEALACGVPVITTRVGNMPEIIEDGVNGFFIERSVEGIVAGIERLRKADWPTMSRAARRSIESGWTWRDKVRNYENMVLELAKEDGLLP